jgi:hypothetical protein
MQQTTAHIVQTYGTKLIEARKINYKMSYVLDNNGDVKSRDGRVIASNNCFQIAFWQFFNCVVHDNFDKSWTQYIGEIHKIIPKLREQTLKQAAASQVSDMVLDDNVLLNEFLRKTNLRIVLYSVSTTHLREPSYPLSPRYIGYVGMGTHDISIVNYSGKHFDLLITDPSNPLVLKDEYACMMRSLYLKYKGYREMQVTQDTTEQQLTAAIDKKQQAALFAQFEKKWPCVFCSIVNSNEDMKCANCGKLRPNTWECNACTSVNYNSNKSCTICGSPKPQGGGKINNMFNIYNKNKKYFDMITKKRA